jgi:hypothetical protein
VAVADGQAAGAVGLPLPLKRHQSSADNAASPNTTSIKSNPERIPGVYGQTVNCISEKLVKK